MGKPLGDFRKAWVTALKAAELPSIRLFHELRRSAIRELVRAGVPQATAIAISGHRTLAVFNRYNIVDTADLLTALEQRAAFRRRATNRGERECSRK